MNIQQVACFTASGLALSTIGGWASSAIAASPTTDTVQLAQAKTVCRRVLPTPVLIREGGVVLRQGPSRTEPKAGLGYAPGERFQTTLANQKDNEDRIWIQVSSPRAGWIPAGRGNRVTNIGYCL